MTDFPSAPSALSAPSATGISAPDLLAVFAGPARDNGFYESGLRGAESACARLGLSMQWREGCGVAAESLEHAAREAAGAGPRMVLVHGGSSDIAVRRVAPDFPVTQFLSTHGAHAGPNFSSFNIRQPQSAFLAGALAAWSTRSGVVGHLSGIRIQPGLDARAAWAQGVRHADPAVRLLSCFCGAQDDVAMAHAHAHALAAQGVDVLYTMLNFGRSGAITACREAGMAQIGNVIDWCALHPDVFIGSAVANNGRLVEQWVDDVAASRIAHGEVRWLGMEDDQAVRLVMAPQVPRVVRERVQALSEALRTGGITLQTDYGGRELEGRA